jgi:hypothetical protein
VSTVPVPISEEQIGDEVPAPPARLFKIGAQDPARKKCPRIVEDVLAIRQTGFGHLPLSNGKNIYSIDIVYYIQPVLFCGVAMKVFPDDEEDTYLFVQADNVVVGTAFHDAGWVRFISARNDLLALESRRYRSVAAIRRAILWMRLKLALRNRGPRRFSRALFLRLHQ